MNDSLLQKTRYTLRSRFRIPQSGPNEIFASSCRQVLDWLANHAILAPIVASLQREYPPVFESVQKIVQDTADVVSAYSPGKHQPTTVTERAALCYAVMEGCSTVMHSPWTAGQFQLRCLAEFITGNADNDVEASIEVLRDVAVDGLFEYLDEHLDDRNAAFGLIIKYKQIVEWFRRTELRDLCHSGRENRTGERALAADLQHFLMHQGVEFMVEPVSGGGEIDLVLRDPNGRYLLLDAKYIRTDASRSDVARTLRGGFHQVMKYCEDYNEPYGFLVTFTESPSRIALSADESDGMPYLSIGARTIFHTVIGISDEPSASRLGTAQEFQISADEMKQTEYHSEH